MPKFHKVVVLHYLRKQPADMLQVKMFQTMVPRVMEDNHDALRSNVDAMRSEIVSMKGEISTFSGRLDCVESRRNSRPSTPIPYHAFSRVQANNSSMTITPEPLHQMLNPPRAPQNQPLNQS